MTQLTTDYCQSLIEYVICYGARVPDGGRNRKMTADESMSWLDNNCPAWRMAAPPPRGLIVVEIAPDDEDDE